MSRTKSTNLRVLTLAAALLAASACGSDAANDSIDDVADAGEEVSEQVDAAADDVDATAGDLADVLEQNGLESLASAVEEIDIAELVDSDEFTFFAPDDEAFRTLDGDDIADLLADPEQFADVLRRHVVGRTIDAAELAEMTSVETEGGTTLDVSVDGDTVMVGDATVTRTDIDVDNGVVHVVDRVFVEA